ncbi:MAG: hypothetical protein ACKO1N_09470, partial [Erythrobacter sp.]
MANEPASTSTDWVTFEAAGRLVDGPHGWHFDMGSQSRPRAEALVSLACDGVIRFSAESWTVRLEGATRGEVSEEEKLIFLRMLFKRIKERQERITEETMLDGDIDYKFNIADDLNGHYELSVRELTPYHQGEELQFFKVIGLKFNVNDISRLFHLSDTPLDVRERSSASSGGRPSIADWEGAALEMARRFYRDELKPK